MQRNAYINEFFLAYLLNKILLFLTKQKTKLVLKFNINY